jgi:hypothetical protein
MHVDTILLLQLLNWKGRYGDLEDTLAASKKENKRLQGNQKMSRVS